MGSVGFIILVVLAIIVLVAIIIVIWVLTANNTKTVYSDVGEPCKVGSDCASGLVCFNNKCLIPPNGPCNRNPDMCAEGGICINGRCVMLNDDDSSVSSGSSDSGLLNTNFVDNPDHLNSNYNNYPNLNGSDSYPDLNGSDSYPNLNNRKRRSQHKLRHRRQNGNNIESTLNEDNIEETLNRNNIDSTLNRNNIDAMLNRGNIEPTPDNYNNVNQVTYNKYSPFTQVTLNEGKTSVYKGYVVDASTIEVNLNAVLNTGVWVLVTSPDANSGAIYYITQKGRISAPINYHPLSCLVLESGCYILCRDNVGNPVLLIAKLVNVTTKRGVSKKIVLEQIIFPSTSNNISINAGDCISLGQTSFKTLMITMDNGIWMMDNNLNWVWHEMDNTDVLYITFINNKRLTMRRNDFDYANFRSEWNCNSHFPKVSNNLHVDFVDYWSKGLIELR